VVAQMSARDGFGCGADVRGGRTLSRCKRGRGIDSVPGQRWARDRISPVADVGGNEPNPVVSDERSPKTQMRAYSGEPYQAALRCAHTALQWMPLRATAGGAMQRAVHRCRLRCKCNHFRLSGWAQSRVLWGYSGATRGVLWGYSSGTLGVLWGYPRGTLGVL
jgi:hypothetical protein